MVNNIHSGQWSTLIGVHIPRWLRIKATLANGTFGLLLCLTSLASAGPFPSGLVSFWNFDEASGLALDSTDSNNGTLGAGATRVQGIIGSGAVSFNNSNSAFIDVGPGTGNNFSVSTGIAVEAVITPLWTGNALDYDHIIRKNDNPDFVLLSFQNDSNTVP